MAAPWSQPLLAQGCCFSLLSVLLRWSHGDQLCIGERKEAQPGPLHLGLEGSHDKNAWNKSFGRGGLHLVYIRKRNKRSLICLSPSLQTIHDVFPLHAAGIGAQAVCVSVMSARTHSPALWLRWVLWSLLAFPAALPQPFPRSTSFLHMLQQVPVSASWEHADRPET